MVVAMDKNSGIGKNNKMPWHFKEDMKFFRKLTWGHTVIMGRKTYESLPPTYRPLPGRKNIVLTSAKNYDVPKEVVVLNNVDKVLELCKDEECFVIGGAQTYKLFRPYTSKIYVTHIQNEYDVDTYFPFDVNMDFYCVSEDIIVENGIMLKFCLYERRK
jgi:dihydrofolate reductase